MNKVLVTGGAGYVGARLVPRLLEEGYQVNVIDLMIYGEEVFNDSKTNPNLKLFKGDIRDISLVEKTLEGVDFVIHLACISNDPSFELNPGLGKEINLDAFRPLVEASKKAGVKRFVYASSSSVYGVKDKSDVVEEDSLEPLTDYSKFKAGCEKILAEYQISDFTTVTIRPATVCGYSPRQRLDVIVNILTNHAYNNGVIKIFGGDQLRPNIHIEDMVDCYLNVLKQPKEKIAGKIYNAGYYNHKVKDIAQIVKNVMGENIKIETAPTDDNRSYHISSEKISRELGFKAKRTIEDAVEDLRKAFEDKKLPNSMSDKKYYNIKTMLDLELK